MKIFLFLFLVTGINYASSFSTQLSRDINDIAKLIPVQDLFEIFDARKFNPISHKASDYVNSINFRNSMYLILRHPLMKEIKEYLEINSVHLDEIFLKIIVDKEKSSRKAGDGRGQGLKLKKFVETAYSVSQMDNIISLVIHKTATSASFRILYTLLNDLNHNKVYTDMISTPKVKDMTNNLNALGINTKEVWKAMSYLFGWDKVTNFISLEEYEIEEEKRDEEESPLLKILRQYINLIPKEKFIVMYRGLLLNPLFQEITVYIYNKEYYKVIDRIGKFGPISQFFDFLKNQGVSLYKFIDLLRDRLGFTYAYFRIPNGLIEEKPYTISLLSFFDLAKQILPVNDIRKLTANLLQTNNDYKMFYDQIMTLVKNNNIDLYFENQKDIRNVAMQYGCNVHKIINFLFSIVGVEYEIPPSGEQFTESIYEFVELFSKVDYINLYDKYKNDTNIWAIVKYLKGPKFGDFIEAFFSTVELKIFVNFLTNQYVPFKAILVDILDRLGIMQWWINYEYFCGKDGKKCKEVANPNAENLNNFVNDRIDLFPLRELLILFQSKLQSNRFFQNLYLEVSNMDGRNLFKKITEHDVLRDFFVKFTEVGYNFRGILQQFSQLFGWGNLLTVDLSLNQTLENFDNLIYRKELFKILAKYPDEVEQLKEFFKNSEFVNSLKLFINEAEIRNIITWMQHLNVPVIDNFNYYSSQQTSNGYNIKLNSQLNWKKMCADIVKFLNKNKLFEFSVAQKYNSIEFHAFLDKIIYANINVAMMLTKNPDYHYVANVMSTTGINILDVYKFIKDVQLDAFDLHKNESRK